MNLLNPAALWAAFIIPLIILVYLLKPRYQERTVSSTLLWEQVIKDLEASSPWQRLRRNLLLFLQLLTALLLVFALTRPFLPVAGGQNRHLILVLDCSASMRAVDVKPSRFEAARQAILKIIDQKGRGDTITLMAMGEEPTVLAAASSDRVQLRQALKQVRPGTGGADLEAVLSLASALVQGDRQASMIVFSDGRTRPVEGEIKLSRPLELRQVGRSYDNVACLNLAARQEGQEVTAVAHLENFGDKTVETEVELYAGQRLLDARTVSLEAGADRNLIWEKLPRDAAVLKTVITRPDDFPADNQSYAAVEDNAGRRALLVTGGNIFLEKSLLLLPGLSLFKTTPQNYSAAMDDYQLYVFDSYLPRRLPAGAILLVNPPAGNNLVPVTGEWKNIGAVQPGADDEMLDYVDVSTWKLAASRRLECPDWARPLLKYRDSPLMLAGEYQGRRVAVLAFDLHNTNIPLQTGFPVLMNNTGNWLLPPSGDIIAPDDSGQAFRLIAPPQTETIRIKPPAAEEEVYHSPFPRYYSTPEPGLYRISLEGQGKKRVVYLARNMGDPLESDLKPASLPYKPEQSGSGTSNRRLNRMEFWPWPGWAILGLLLLEWEVYRRGR